MIQLQLSAIVFQNSSPFLNMQDQSIVGEHLPLNALLSNPNFCNYESNYQEKSILRPPCFCNASSNFKTDFTC